MSVNKLFETSIFCTNLTYVKLLFKYYICLFERFKFKNPICCLFDNTPKFYNEEKIIYLDSNILS